ncbi:hypothetical protein LINGRAHAP2_LOCUS27468 [Linum grandiflorum]
MPSMILSRTRRNLVPSSSSVIGSCDFNLIRRFFLSDGMKTSSLMSLLDVSVFLLYQL